jgi:hypothetical protein
LSRCFCDCSSNSCGINWLAILLLLLCNLLSLSNKSSLNISIRSSASSLWELILTRCCTSSLNKSWGRYRYSSNRCSYWDVLRSCQRSCGHWNYSSNWLLDNSSWWWSSTCGSALLGHSLSKSLLKLLRISSLTIRFSFSYCLSDSHLNIWIHLLSFHVSLSH